MPLKILDFRCITMSCCFMARFSAMMDLMPPGLMIFNMVDIEVNHKSNSLVHCGAL